MIYHYQFYNNKVFDFIETISEESMRLYLDHSIKHGEFWIVIKE